MEAFQARVLEAVAAAMPAAEPIADAPLAHTHTPASTSVVPFAKNVCAPGSICAPSSGALLSVKARVARDAMLRRIADEETAKYVLALTRTHAGTHSSAVSNAAEPGDVNARLPAGGDTQSSKEVHAADTDGTAAGSTVTREFLRSACEVLSAHTYAGVVEERAISGVCGYPLCANTPTHKTALTTSELVEQAKAVATGAGPVQLRGNYCSRWCLKCSRFLAAQMSSVELASRALNPAAQDAIELLDDDPATRAQTTVAKPASTSSVREVAPPGGEFEVVERDVPAKAVVAPAPPASYAAKAMAVEGYALANSVPSSIRGLPAGATAPAHRVADTDGGAVEDAAPVNLSELARRRREQQQRRVKLDRSKIPSDARARRAELPSPAFGAATVSPLHAVAEAGGGAPPAVTVPHAAVGHMEDAHDADKLFLPSPVMEIRRSRAPRSPAEHDGAVESKRDDGSSQLQSAKDATRKPSKKSVRFTADTVDAERPKSPATGDVLAEWRAALRGSLERSPAERPPVGQTPSADAAPVGLGATAGNQATLTSSGTPSAGDGAQPARCDSGATMTSTPEAFAAVRSDDATVVPHQPLVGKEESSPSQTNDDDDEYWRAFVGSDDDLDDEELESEVGGIWFNGRPQLAAQETTNHAAASAPGAVADVVKPSEVIGYGEISGIALAFSQQEEDVDADVDDAREASIHADDVRSGGRPAIRDAAERNPAAGDGTLMQQASTPAVEPVVLPISRMRAFGMQTFGCLFSALLAWRTADTCALLRLGSAPPSSDATKATATQVSRREYIVSNVIKNSEAIRAGLAIDLVESQVRMIASSFDLHDAVPEFRPQEWQLLAAIIAAAVHQRDRTAPATTVDETWCGAHGGDLRTLIAKMAAPRGSRAVAIEELPSDDELALLQHTLVYGVDEPPPAPRVRETQPATADGPRTTSARPHSAPLQHVFGDFSDPVMAEAERQMLQSMRLTAGRR